jgi:hypothetical protein
VIPVTISSPEGLAMRHFSTARDILVPLAGVMFFVMLLTLVR